ncbi:MAG: amidohydrolase [Firmicutes bacterium]|nr:amidohydrolase [Bacillota bacterium]MBQ2217650.1 amidohydrolase [Bacillota bacterium]MBQ4003990.1 amidohydrolase [Bacillota bacterium]MBR3395125.1 amidohydrolase [Bacillota bacterium]
MDNMDRIFYNGQIKTLDDQYPMVSAVAVKNGIVMAVGSDEEMKALAGPATEMVDLKGAFMCPGLIDSHMHLLLLSNKLRRTDIGVAKTFKECMDIMAKAAEAKKGTDGWAMGIGFNQDDWTDCNEVPTRLDLDKACGDVPAYIERACGHIATLNTKAMELMGMMNEKEGESQYKLRYFEDGTPNGVLCEDTVRLVEEYFPVPTVPEMKQLILMGANYIASKGLAGVHSDDLNLVVPVKDMPVILQAYKELSEADELPIRVHQQCRMLNLPMIEKFCSEYKVRTKWGKNFTIGDIKIMGDGSLGAHTAVLRGEYKNAPDDHGIPLHDDEELYAMFRVAHNAGYPIVVHVIGDGAMDQVVNGYELVMNENPKPNMRHGIIHCQIMDEAQQDRFVKLNLLAYAQPVFVRYDSQIVDDCVGSELAKTSYNWRRYIDLGVHMSGGSDCPVEDCDPLANMYYAVTRMGMDGKPWYPENAVTMEEALRMFTIEGAYSAFEEAERGSITIGKYADFTVLDKNIMENPPEELLNTKVLMTVVNGKTVYEG